MRPMYHHPSITDIIQDNNNNSEPKRRLLSFRMDRPRAWAFVCLMWQYLAIHCLDCNTSVAAVSLLLPPRRLHWFKEIITNIEPRLFCTYWTMGWCESLLDVMIIVLLTNCSRIIMDLSICMPSLHRVVVLHSRVLNCYGLYGGCLLVLCSAVQCLGKQSRQCPISRSLGLPMEW